MNLGRRVWRRLLDALDHNRTPVLLASLFLILLGTRAALISYAGSPRPFLDEWEADGARLLQPYIQGNLTISDLFIPLNEHRIFFTKLLVLLIFNVSGYWDVVLQILPGQVGFPRDYASASRGLPPVRPGRLMRAGVAPAAQV